MNETAYLREVGNDTLSTVILHMDMLLDYGGIAPWLQPRLLDATLGQYAYHVRDLWRLFCDEAVA